MGSPESISHILYKRQQQEAPKTPPKLLELMRRFKKEISAILLVTGLTVGGALLGNKLHDDAKQAQAAAELAEKQEKMRQRFEDTYALTNAAAASRIIKNYKAYKELVEIDMPAHNAWSKVYDNGGENPDMQKHTVAQFSQALADDEVKLQRVTPDYELYLKRWQEYQQMLSGAGITALEDPRLSAVEAEFIARVKSEQPKQDDAVSKTADHPETVQPDVQKGKAGASQPAITAQTTRAQPPLRQHTHRRSGKK